MQDVNNGEQQNYKVVQADELVRQLDFFNELDARYAITEMYDENRKKTYDTKKVL
jgi:hypothetical protein